MEQFLIALSKNQFFLSSLAGSLVGALFRKNLGVMPLVLCVVGGLTTAYFLTPAIMVFWGSGSMSMLGFLSGLIGMNIVAGIISLSEYISKNVVHIVNNFLKKRFDFEIHTNGNGNGHASKHKPSPKSRGDIDDIDSRR